MSKAGTTGGAATVVRNAGAAPKGDAAFAGNGSIDGGTGGDAGLKAASAGFLKGRRGSAPAAPQAPAAPAKRPATPPAPTDQTGDLETDVAAGAAPEPTEDLGDPTDKAYESDQEDDLGTGPTDSAEPGEGEGTDSTQATDGLDAFAKTFGLKSATAEHRDAIVSDVEAYLAQAKGAQPSPEAARTPAAAQGNQGPQATPPASPKSEPAPASQGDGSGDLQPLSDEQIASAAEYGPGVESLAKSHNVLVKQLSESRKQLAAMGQMAQQFPAMQAALEWMQVQPVVQSFVDEMVKAGLPPIPPEQMREFALDSAGYLNSKNPDGKNPAWDGRKAMHAMYMAKFGSKVQEQASQAREEGRREVVKSLEKATRRRDVAGGPGALPAGNRAPDDDAAILQHARAWRRQNNTQR